MAKQRRGFVLFVYSRAARGVASRAFRDAGFITIREWVKRKQPEVAFFEYWSRNAIWAEAGGPKAWADPRYTGEATDEEMAMVTASIGSSRGIEIYHD